MYLEVWITKQLCDNNSISVQSSYIICNHIELALYTQNGELETVPDINMYTVHAGLQSHTIQIENKHRKEVSTKLEGFRRSIHTFLQRNGVPMVQEPTKRGPGIYLLPSLKKKC